LRKLTMVTVVFLVVLLIFGLTLAGCGQEEQSATNILRIGYMREIESLNPHVIWSVQAYEVMNLNYNYLMSWDDELNVIPGLAAGWEVDEAGTLWTFNLQEGVTWQDGEPCTAEDVKFTFEYIRDNEMGYFYDKVKEFIEIEVIDDLTFTAADYGTDYAGPYLV